MFAPSLQVGLFRPCIKCSASFFTTRRYKKAYCDACLRIWGQERGRAYRLAHPDRVKTASARRWAKIMADPVRYQLVLAEKRERERLRRKDPKQLEQLRKKDRARQPIGMRYFEKRRHLALAFADAARAGGCVDCGNKNLTVLDSDHVDGKTAGIARLANTGRVTELLKELERCVTRCANCHRIVTAQRRGGLAA